MAPSRRARTHAHAGRDSPEKPAPSGTPFAEALSVLNPKQAALVRHFVRLENGNEAARLAGDSKTRAKQTADDLLERGDVMADVRLGFRAFVMGKDEVLGRTFDAARQHRAVLRFDAMNGRITGGQHPRGAVP